MAIGDWTLGERGRSARSRSRRLGDQMVPNNAYSGPSATTAPYNQKTITRHYGFGNPPTPNCNAGSGSPAACPSVTVGGIPLTE